MKLIRRYIWWSVLMPAIGFVGLIVVLDGLFSYIAELESLKADYQAWQALQYVLMSLPRSIYEFLPMGILLGALVGLGMLANTNELTVIRTAGVTIGQITRMSLRPAVLLIVLGLVLGEFVVPNVEQIAQNNRAVAEGKGEALSSRHGFWHREGDEIIHINAVDTEGVLYGVTRFRYAEDHTLKASLFIEEATFNKDKWELENIKGSKFKDDRVETYAEESGEWKSGLTPEFLSVVAVKPELLAMSNLWEYIQYLEEQKLESSEYKLTLWQKLLQPLAIVGMILIAISFVFGPLREVPMSLRLTTGLIAGLVFHYGQQFIGHMSMVFHVSPIAAAAAPPLFCCILGIWLLSRIR